MNGAESSTPLSFDADIKPLFRDRDRNAMRRHFDLWSAGDVLANSDAILGALRAGKMPCDGAWPDDQIELLGRWIAQGGDE